MLRESLRSLRNLLNSIAGDSSYSMEVYKEDIKAGYKAVAY